MAIFLRVFLLLSVCGSMAFPAKAGEGDCTIVMGYRTNERLPLIHAAPDNSGLYQELFSRAASDIACQLEVVRFPKKRILNMMKLGEVDFYPGFNFTEERAEFFYYFDNGLPGGGDVGISSSSLEEITDLRQLNGNTVLEALGGPDYYSDVDGVRIRRPPELTLERAVELLRSGVGDFYIYNRITIEFFLRSQGITDMKVHENCCGGTMPLYMAFSRASAYFDEIPNPLFDPDKPLSIDNFPTLVDRSSTAYRFARALTKLAQEGYSQSLAERYYYGTK